MAMSPRLEVRTSQSLTLTPQLMQSIQLLQMTHVELTQFIEQEVEKNPLLEIASGEDGARDAHGQCLQSVCGFPESTASPCWRSSSG